MGFILLDYAIYPTGGSTAGALRRRPGGSRPPAGCLRAGHRYRGADDR